MHNNRKTLDFVLFMFLYIYILVFLHFQCFILSSIYVSVYSCMRIEIINLNTFLYIYLSPCLNNHIFRYILNLAQIYDKKLKKTNLNRKYMKNGIYMYLCLYIFILTNVSRKPQNRHNAYGS